MASAFQYLTVAEYVAYNQAISGVADSALTEAQISDAERWIDAYCGPWPRHYVPRSTGYVSAVSGATVTSDVFGSRKPNYWAAGGLYLHVYEGAGAGEKRLITASTSAEQVTLATSISGLDTTSRFVLRQESVFPRRGDLDLADVPYIPEPVKHATAIQVAYAAAISPTEGLWGSSSIDGSKDDVTGESYSSGYSYQRNPNLTQGIARYVAPQALAILHGYRTTVGRMRIRF